MQISHQNHVWPPLAEQGYQEVTEHYLHGYLWFQCPERPNLWSEPGLIHAELEVLFLLMMAPPKSSKECSIGSISREQVGHGTSTGPYASRNSFTAAAIYGQIWANVVVLQPNVVSITSSLVWKAEVFQNVQLHESVGVSIRSHQ